MIFSEENSCENVICKMVAILSRPQCVKLALVWVIISLAPNRQQASSQTHIGQRGRILKFNFNVSNFVWKPSDRWMDECWPMLCPPQIRLWGIKCRHAPTQPSSGTHPTNYPSITTNPQKQCCPGRWKHLSWSEDQEPNYSKAKFAMNLNCELKIVSEMVRWFMLVA